MRADYYESVKGKIAKTAEDLLQEKGVEKVTIRCIAQKLQVSVGSIYTYFPDKTAILREIYSQSCRDFLKALEEAPQSHSSPEENFIDLIVFACNFRIENSYRYREIFHFLEDEDFNELELVRAFMLKRLSDLKLPTLSNPENLRKADRTIATLCEGVAVNALTKGEKNKQTTEMVIFALRSLLFSWKKQNTKGTL